MNLPGILRPMLILLMLTVALLGTQGCASESPEDAADVSVDTGTSATSDTGAQVGTDTGGEPPADVAGDTGTATNPDAAVDAAKPEAVNPDINGDGTVNILVIGTNQPIRDGAEAFSPDAIATELQNILSQDATLDAQVNVVAENLFRSKELVTGYGQGGDEYTWMYYCHSLAQYYFWPEGREDRLKNLSG